MPKKSGRSSIAFEKEAIGQFLLYLYGCQQVKPTTDWSIPKKGVHAEFRKFLNLPKNANLRKRMGGKINEVGVLLHRTGYLIDTPKGSDLFCLNYQKIMLFKEIEELHKDFEKKLIPYHKENKKLHRLSAKTFFQATAALPTFLPPTTLLELKKKKYDDEELCKSSTAFADYFNGGRIFTPENIFGAMKLLLQIEDVDILEKYRRLIQRDVKLTQSRPLKYSLKLTRKSRKIGCFNEALLSPYNRLLIVAECPVTKSLPKEFFLNILLSGSRELKVPGKTIGPTFNGQIESVYERTVTFGTEGKLPEDPNVSYLIVFCPARLTLRYQYNALECYEVNKATLQRFLFPNTLPEVAIPEKRLSFYDKKIAANPEQKQAVQNVVSISKSNELLAPFIIFGPPGTGKTSVIVESILQLLLHEPNAKILVTAGPNCACDEIALRICSTLSLGKEPRTQILARIYCWSQERRRENINKLLLEYSNMYDWHFLPDVKVLQDYRVVVCTLSAVGKLTTGSLQQFTHVFLDEGAASSMPESLVGLVNTLNEKSKLIIAGDHKQLGPILNSRRAKELGLGKSLLEKLLHRKCYAEVNKANGEYNQLIQTRLCRNFRSHTAIVKLFSQLYYDDKLQAMAPAEETNWATKWEGLNDPNFPILFHAVHGREELDDESDSIHNGREIGVVFQYVNMLLEKGLGGGRKLEETDIGIISPYRSQCMAIQEDLNALRLFQIETGTAEAYRGKEKAVIIVSFVRSKFKSLGFLKDPERLNVILSRAKSLLILIGNDAKLSEYKDYEFVIKECQQHGNFIPAP
ncbi:putative helicase MOV-10 [Rhagoletis pomonella]|uniref:putative helicase MOV-10 n=1 Tax=Rhagoletis pomonella TaxID=28610 RepID=UPI001782C4C8|nr:putative helicase MOV-10 [Rhagoletis pomonella]